MRIRRAVRTLVAVALLLSFPAQAFPAAVPSPAPREHDASAPPEDASGASVLSATDRASTRKLADRFFERVRKEDVKGAVELFHLPQDNERADNDREVRILRSVLRVFASELGRIRSVTPLDREVEAEEVSIGSGTLAYWLEHPFAVRLRYRVDFERAGKGTVVVEECRIGDSWQIRSVRYGLETARQDAGEWIARLLGKVRKVLDEHEDQDPESAPRAI